MKPINVPIVLSYHYAELKEFSMDKGLRKDAVISNNTRLNLFPHNYSFRYRQKNNVIGIPDTQYNKWIHFAYSDRNKSILKQDLTGIENRHVIDKIRSLNYDEICWSALNYAGLSSMSL
ncbi:MAG: hypothetical protein LBV43_09970 [Prevotella sp.]|jgi:hypothetical protein|nr:hypothetical protein [Prevotella sp.]